MKFVEELAALPSSPGTPDAEEFAKAGKTYNDLVDYLTVIVFRIDAMISRAKQIEARREPDETVD